MVCLSFSGGASSNTLLLCGSCSACSQYCDANLQILFYTWEAAGEQVDHYHVYVNVLPPAPSDL